jgi:uncharacterized membrane protein
MSLFITEAAVVGAKEAAKLVLVWFLFSSYIKGRDREGLIVPFYIGVLLASVTPVVMLFLSPGFWMKEFLSKLIGYVFFIFFLGSVVAYYQPSGGGSLSSRFLAGRGLKPLVFLLTIFYFLPDIAGTSMFVDELSLMKETAAGAYLSAALGFVLTVIVLYASLQKLGWNAGKFFDTAQLLLFLAVVKLVAGGIRGFAELSLIPSVQSGIMKFVHDVVHHTFTIMLVPDHPMLKITTWKFIGIFFGSNFALSVTLIILLLPPLAFLYHSAASPLPEPEREGMTGADRRKFKAEARADRVRKAIPAAFFVLMILVSWFSARGEEISSLYTPAPKPVIEDSGNIVIPLTDPTMDLMDGKLHKFSITRNGERVVLLVIRKPDGKLSVCLDACEICPPDGYGQSEDNVLCIYCMTPIPVDTLGKPGGCNPIPLDATVGEREISIDIEELDRKWRAVMSGETREGIR